MQAQSLSTLIENAVKRDGLVGKFRDKAPWCMR